MARVKPFKLHPLHGIVMCAYEDSEVHDASSLLIYLAGANSFGKDTEKATEAYILVAEDVLGYMESQGHLYRDSEGWWRLTVEG